MKRILILICSAMTVGGLTVGPAQADSADDQYLGLLAAHGLTGPADQLIAAGRQYCDARSQVQVGSFAGPYLAAMNDLGNRLGALGFDDGAKRQIITDAARAYCPQFAPPQ